MPDSIEVTVESLGGLGDGIALFKGKTVFIPKSCPGDRLEITIIHENRDGMQGVITRVLSPGPNRRTAPCPYFERCGGCTLQHFIPDYYREFKTRMFHSALERAGFPFPDATVMFIPERSRRRVEFKARHDGNRIALAFHDLRSHNPAVIDECLLLAPALQALIAPLNAALSHRDFSSFLYSVALTAADSGIDMLLTFKAYETGKLPSLDSLAISLGIARICARTPDSKAVVIADSKPVTMQLGSYDIAVPPEAFLQATAEGQVELTRICVEAVQSQKTVVDLFCGIGAYAFPISQCAKVHAVELDQLMIQNLSQHIRHHAITNMTAEQRDLFKQPLTAQELSGFTAAIINPPRLGAKAQTLALAQSPVSTIVMISCNPATFSRDAAILKNNGFRLKSVKAVDQFVWSQHLEIAAVFQR